MNHAYPTKRVRYMDPVVWQPIGRWQRYRLEMADALVLLWQVGENRAQWRGGQQHRERLKAVPELRCEWLTKADRSSQGQK